MGPRVTVLFNYCFEYQTILPFRKKIPKGILFLLRAHLSHFYFLLPNLTQLLKNMFSAITSILPDTSCLFPEYTFSI